MQSILRTDSLRNIRDWFTFVEMSLELCELALLESDLQAYQVVLRCGADVCPLARNIMRILDRV